MRRRAVLSLLVLFLVTCRREAPSYVAHIEQARAERVTRLQAEKGWLTLAGLFWLQPGTSRVGSSAQAEVRLPVAAPAQVGTLTVDETGVALRVQPGVAATSDGAPVTTLPLRDDAAGASTVVSLGSVSFYVIRRGTRLGVRVKDSASAVRTGFRGLEYFSVDSRWRIPARLVRYEAPRRVSVPTVLGEDSEELSPGELEFTLDGRAHRLQALSESGEQGLFVVFGDATNGRSTHGAGRFLDTEAPAVDGSVMLDFNLAYNPPCAFTPYATCPVPSAKNRLPVAIEAGERAYEHRPHLHGNRSTGTNRVDSQNAGAGRCRASCLSRGALSGGA